MKQKPLNTRLPSPYNGMTAEELDAEVAKFDRPMPGLPGKALTPRQKLRHRRARRKAGRPVVGKGAQRITITLERGLLNEVDAYARHNHMSRSAFIATGVRTLLKAG